MSPLVGDIIIYKSSGRSTLTRRPFPLEMFDNFHCFVSRLLFGFSEEEMNKVCVQCAETKNVQGNEISEHGVGRNPLEVLNIVCEKSAKPKNVQGNVLCANGLGRDSAALNSWVVNFMGP